MDFERTRHQPNKGGTSIAHADSARVIDAILDIFSPVTETMGTLGDHVRLYRTKSLLRVIQETKTLAAQAGIKLKQPPLKFLVPFLEEASLNDDDDKKLEDLWINLLLQASQDGYKANRLFIDLLSRLTRPDAENLEIIVRNHRHGNTSVNQIVDVAFGYERENIDEIIEDVLLLHNGEEDKAISQLIKFIENRGIIVISCGFYSFGEERSCDIYESHPDFPDEDDLSLHSLASLGLIKFPIVYNRSYRKGIFSMTVCTITALGAEFFLSTHDQSLRCAASELPRYESSSKA